MVMRRRMILSLCVLAGLFAAGYGVMFTLLDDFRDRYGISEATLGAVVAIGFFASFVAQVLFAPLADRGHAAAPGVHRHVLQHRRRADDGLRSRSAGAGRRAAGDGTRRGHGHPGHPAHRHPRRPRAHLGHNVGLLLAADVAGFAIGPALSAVLVGPFGIAAPFLVIVGATIVCLPLIARVHVDEASPRPHRPGSTGQVRLRPAAPAAVRSARSCFGAGVFVMIGTFDSLWVLVLDDLHTADWIANVGITLFALPLIVLGSPGGRLAQRVGPFRVAHVGPVARARRSCSSTGQLPTGGAMFAVAMLHSLSDGLTVSASGVAVGMVAPGDRQAGAQGLLGGTQTLVGGIAAILAGQLYSGFGRGAAYGVCAALMVALVVAGRWFARGAVLTVATESAPADLVPS